MPIPDYQTLMPPLLKRAANKDIRVPEIESQIAEEFGLSEKERDQMLPSGRQKVLHSFPDERFIAPTAYFLKRLEILDPQSMAQADYIRRFRNNLVHGISVPSRGAIEDMIVSLESLLDKLEPPRPAAGKARKKRR